MKVLGKIVVVLFLITIFASMVPKGNTPVKAITPSASPTAQAIAKLPGNALCDRLDALLIAGFASVPPETSARCHEKAAEAELSHLLSSQMPGNAQLFNEYMSKKTFADLCLREIFFAAFILGCDSEIKQAKNQPNTDPEDVAKSCQRTLEELLKSRHNPDTCPRWSDYIRAVNRFEKD